MRLRYPIFLFFALAALIVTSCGAGNKAASTTVPLNATFPPTTPELDKDLATGILLQKADFPSGFDISNYSDSFNRFPPLAPELPSACAKVPLASPTAQNSSALFGENNDSRAATTFILSDSSLYASAKEVTTEMAAIRSPGSNLCVRRLLEPVLSEFLTTLNNTTSSGVNTSFDRIPALNTSVDVVAFRMADLTTLDGQKTNAYLDSITVSKDRAELSITIFSTGSKPSLEMEQSLIAKARERLQPPANKLPGKGA